MDKPPGKGTTQQSGDPMEETSERDSPEKRVNLRGKKKLREGKKLNPSQRGLPRTVFTKKETFQICFRATNWPK